MAAWYLNYHAIYIIATLSLLKLSGIYMMTNDKTGEDVKRNTLQSSRLLSVYDITHVILDKEYSEELEILPDALFTKDLNTSKYHYFISNGAKYHKVCENSTCVSGILPGISVMFGNGANRHGVSATMKAIMQHGPDDKFNSAAIANILKMNDSFVDSVTIWMHYLDCTRISEKVENLARLLNVSSVKPTIKYGIEYDEEFLEECVNTWFQPPEQMDHTILRIYVEPESHMLSYQVFFEKITRLITLNRNFVRKSIPNCTVYVRIDIENYNYNNGPIISLDNYKRYDALMTKYLRAFSKQFTGQEQYIFYPVLKSAHITGNTQYIRQSLTVPYSVYAENAGNRRTPHVRPPACEHQQVAKIMLLSVQSIIWYDSHGESPKALSAACPVSHEITKFLSQQQTYSLIMNSPHDNGPSILRMLDKIPKSLLPRIRIYLSDWALAHNENVPKLLQAKNIDIGCSRNTFNREWYTNVSGTIKDTDKYCGKLFNISNVNVLSWGFKMTKEDSFFGDLSFIHFMKQYFEKRNPGKTFSPDILLDFNESKDKDHSSLYCDFNAKQVNIYYDAVLAFANIHRWTSLVLSRYGYDIWSYIQTDEEINRTATSFPVLFRTNIPLSADVDLPMTYACIQKTLDASQSQINFSENPYSGATFKISLRESSPLSITEIQTSVQLVLKRFPVVEVIVANREEFRKVHNVVSKLTRSFGQLSGISNPVVYIEVPLTDAINLRQQIFSLVTNSLVGVHVSNWESLSHEQWNLWNDFPQIPVLNLGLSVQNCSHEMNSGLAKLKSLPFMPQVSYVVCNVKPVIPDNVFLDSMNIYLGTLFYTKTYMEQFLSSQKESGRKVEVIFRLNFICYDVAGMEEFLRFLNDVNQHSVIYKIRYFVVPAFETEVSSVRCSNSWWRLDSYADLNNLTAYVNREDEYAGRPARPEIPPPEPVQNSNILYFIIGPIAVALFIFAILAFWIHHQRIKIRILTEREVNQFFNGSEPAIPAETNSLYMDFTNMKFPKHYQIPLKDIEIGEMIGSGQFGVVHRGILSKRIEAAIKTPRSDCDRDQFKSILSEVKILCHIGEHLNIVSFFGAYTKDIANGNLHIILEYCNNGCLLKFLRESRQDGEMSPSISLFQLYGFSLQIASGMEYIAEKRVIHGDLAARNVLLTSEMTCKIADFGLSRRLYEMGEYKKTSQEPLPWKWMAPESLRDMEFTIKSDVWSYGVTLWEIFSLGTIPYPGMSWSVNFVTELENGMRMGKALHATENIHAKILECWNGNSEARPTFTELKEYFIGLRNEQYLKLDQV